MSLSEAAEFVAKFIEDEYATWVATYTEKRNDLFHKKREVFQIQYYADDLTIDIHRKPNPDNAWFEQAKHYLLATQRRILFKVSEYLLPGHGQMYAAFLSTADAGGDSYFEVIFIARLDSGYRIVSSYLTDHAGSFEHNDGVDVGDFAELPAPQQVLKYCAPNDPADLEEYEAT